MEYKLEWRSVNTRLPRDRFSVESLGAPQGTKILDIRLDPNHPVEIGEIGREQYVGDPIEMPHAAGGSHLGWWLLALNIAMFAIVAAWVIRRRLRRNSRD
ncbi:MAG: hypothetical protein ACOYOZ_11925 [Pirellula sp.]